MAAPRARREASYRQAGVDVEGADQWLARMKPLVRSTWGAQVLPDRGQFAGLITLGRSRFKDPVLVASTDGVGTKLKVAQLAGRYEGLGIDAVAMNVNDVLVYGAQPLFFLDYIAIGRLQPPLMSALLRGVVDGCRQSGCALLGGETAEMPGVYRGEDFDLAGFCVGVVERRRILDGRTVRAGDVIVGLASSGVHANGFSLVRQALSSAQLRRHADALLTPTRIYVKPVAALQRQVQIKAITHVTGGGLARRLPSLVGRQPRLQARLHERSWPVPAIFDVIQRAGGIAPREMSRTFNMGIGLALVCPRQEAVRAVRVANAQGCAAWVIGHLERG
jgi:phosphoribosylformylglycinamidine cyclo-ligase